jgi:hypothetical protein
MSLTNQEMSKIIETASQLHDTIGEIYPAADGTDGSFFQDRDALNLFESDIFEYTIENPMKLKTELSKMWQYQDAEYMEQFTNICVVAVFKYKEQAESSPEKQEGLSPFIYEF